MKHISANLHQHLQSGTTTMAYCWRLTCQDGHVLGFTEHDCSLTLLGTIFQAASGFTPENITQGLGFPVQVMEVLGALSSDNIEEFDLLQGRYDDAEIEIFWVNWKDVSQYILLSKGHFGEIKRSGQAFQIAINSLAHRFNQQIGRTYQRLCSASLGDWECTINITSAPYRAEVFLLTGGRTHMYTTRGLENHDLHWFTGGQAKSLNGANKGISFEIKNHFKNMNGILLEFWSLPPFPFTPEDQVMCTAGCQKDFRTCQKKFNNHLNFRGFPHIPGNDILTRVAAFGEPNQTDKR